MGSGLRRWLERVNPLIFTLFAGLAGFCAYFSMYAFRKPFAAATFDAVDGWTFAVDYKIALVLAQVAGYATSKLIGVKVISEISPSRRGAAILGLIGASWLALLAFAIVPAPWNVAALVLNGLPLGMIWGLVFGFMEGRRTSEVLGAILCASFILSSGVVKSVGKWLMVDLDVSPFWMPAATGALFMPLLAISVWALVQLPPPSPADEAARVRRQPMDRAQRRAFLAIYWPGVVLLVAAYVLLTALRDFRDNFAAEIWTGLGFGEASDVFTSSELPVAVIALAVLGAVMLVRDNLRAILVMHGVILAGFLLLGFSTLAYQADVVTPLIWMVLTGAGLYMAYTPFNAMLFDRMIAFSGRIGTAGFLIYLADASGYLGSVALLIWRNFASVQLDWLGFFIASVYATSAIGAVCTILAGFYFLRRRRAGDVRAPAADAEGTFAASRP